MEILFVFLYLLFNVPFCLKNCNININTLRSGTKHDGRIETRSRREPPSHGGAVRERDGVPPRARAGVPRREVPAGAVSPEHAHRLRQLPQRTRPQGNTHQLKPPSFYLRAVDVYMMFF